MSLLSFPITEVSPKPYLARLAILTYNENVALGRGHCILPYYACATPELLNWRQLTVAHRQHEVLTSDQVIDIWGKDLER